MSDASGNEKTDLSDVMLAMDVVDTLRHEEAVLKRELGREDQERELVEKVKRIYASQGIEVSDAVVAEGVAALREERFAYRPPLEGFQHWLARRYVKRGAWAKGGLWALAALIAGYALYQFTVVAPRERGLAKAAQELNLEIARQQDRLQMARDRSAALGRNLDDALAKASGSQGAGLKQLAADARQSLNAAQEKIASITGLALEAAPKAVGNEAEAVKSRLARRAELMTALESDLVSAQKAVEAIAEVGVLPEKLAAERDASLQEARTPDARQQTEALYADAVAALNRGDIDGARQGTQRLQQFRSQLVQEYEIRIVSRPGEPSGVWRFPEDKPGVRNYYLIVEAVTPGGETLTVPVTSEEDGKTRSVTKWGMRVDADVFERIRQDKQDDGIIGNRRFGVKRRGELLPTYVMPTTGGAITEW